MIDHKCLIFATSTQYILTPFPSQFTSQQTTTDDRVCDELIDVSIQCFVTEYLLCFYSET